VTFFAEVPSAGAYRLYLDFQHNGQVRTAEFTVDAGGSPAPASPASAPAPASPPSTPAASPAGSLAPASPDQHTHG
jgi:hypothetical protein